MNKKVSTLLAAITAFACVGPAAAGANTPTLFDHDGRIAVGVDFLETSLGFVVTTSLGNLKCAKATVTVEVTNNSGGTVRGVGQGQGTTSSCEITTNPSKKISITDFTIAEMHSANAGSGTVNLTFKADIPVGTGTIDCHFSAAGVPFTYEVGVTKDVTKITGDLTGTPSLCEPGIYHDEKTDETEDGRPIWVQ